MHRLTYFSIDFSKFLFNISGFTFYRLEKILFEPMDYGEDFFRPHNSYLFDSYYTG